jgi:hypothetical protein
MVVELVIKKDKLTDLDTAFKYIIINLLTNYKLEYLNI